MSARATYSFVTVSPTRVVIRDSDGDRSITNDAEAVVHELLKDGKLTPGLTRLFYFDTDDRLDELVFDKRGFVSFKPGPATEDELDDPSDQVLEDQERADDEARRMEDY